VSVLVPVGFSFPLAMMRDAARGGTERLKPQDQSREVISKVGSDRKMGAYILNSRAGSLGSRWYFRRLSPPLSWASFNTSSVIGL
jgi:hypothetical protein